MRMVRMRIVWVAALASCLLPTTTLSAATLDDILVATGGSNGGFVRDGNTLVGSVSFSALSGSTLAAALPNGMLVQVDDDAAGNVNIWDESSGSWLLQNSAATGSPATGLAVDPNTGNIAVGTSTGGLIVYDSNLNFLSGVADASFAALDSLAFNSAGHIIIAADGDLIGGVNDLGLRTVTGGFGGWTAGAATTEISSLAVRASDGFVVTGETNGDLVIWDSAVDGVLQAQSIEASFEAITDVIFDSNDNVVFGADGNLVGGIDDVVIRSGVNLGFFGNWIQDLGAQVTALGIQSDGDIIVGATDSLFLYNSTGTSQLASDTGYGVINSVDAMIVVLPGDFDGNGNVDGADFLKWQRDLGDAPNLALWEANFGTPAALSAASAIAVPEPTTAMLFALGVIGLVGSRHRRR